MSSTVTTDRRADRIAAVVAALPEHEIEALVVSHLPNVRYLTGFSGTAGLLVVRPSGVTLITDFRYEAQAEHEVGSIAAVDIVDRDQWARADACLGRGIARVGYEADALTAREAERLPARRRGRTWVAATGIVESLRAAKTPEEVDAIRDAACLAGEAFQAAAATIRVGQRERDIAAALERELRIRGSEWHPFPTIVASGPRSALPHAGTTSRTVGAGEWLLLDFGAQVEGYCADITRTVVVGGRADEKQKTIYGLVREAQQRAITHLRAGMTGRDGDALARSVIEARGFGSAFGHSLGHGLGLEVHEAPRLGRTGDTEIPDQAVVTVEPGIYLPGWGGVRIEDDVVVGTDGTTVLSDGVTDLMELP